MQLEISQKKIKAFTKIFANDVEAAHGDFKLLPVARENLEKEIEKIIAKKINCLEFDDFFDEEDYFGINWGSKKYPTKQVN